ncbi:MAG: hypothetical protein V2A78_05965 [bacterium]
MKKRLSDILLPCLLILVIFFLGQAVGRTKVSMIPMKQEQLTPMGLLMEALGEMRYTLAAYLWIKVDIYHHEMIAEGHDWKKNTEIVPMIRFVTILDPQFAAAYDFGGYHLAVNLGRGDEGLKFLSDGLRNNPENSDLLQTMGFVCFHLKRYAQAVIYLERAIKGRTTQLERQNTLRLLTHSWIRLGEKKKALYCLGELLKMEPGMPWALKQYEILTGKTKRKGSGLEI